MSNETQATNFASEWIESLPLCELQKTFEGETAVLNVTFDSNMDFDENQDLVHLTLDGNYLLPGWSFKQEIEEFQQENDSEGMSNVKADYFLHIQNLDDETLTKRILVHSFDLFIPAKAQNADGSFDFLTEKENRKLLESKVKTAFNQALTALKNPQKLSNTENTGISRARKNPFQEQAAKVVVHADEGLRQSPNSKSIELSKKNIGVGAVAMLLLCGLIWGMASASKDDNMQNSLTQNQANPLVAANNTDPGAVAALNLTKQTLEGMGLDVSKTGADLGCLTTN